MPSAKTMVGTQRYIHLALQSIIIELGARCASYRKRVAHSSQPEVEDLEPIPNIVQ